MARTSHHGAKDNATDHNELHTNALEREVKLLQEMLNAMREDRDAWRDQAAKEREERRELAQRLALAAPIAGPTPARRPETPPAPERRPG
jgi:Lon protease-like protein